MLHDAPSLVVEENISEMTGVAVVETILDKCSEHSNASTFTLCAGVEKRD